MAKLRTRKHKVVLARSRGGDAGITFVLVLLGIFMFIPMYFVLFDVIVNEIVFLISLSDFLLLMYRMQEALVW